MKFTEDHEWILLEDNVATVGITKHAAEQLGDVVFVELPEIGKQFDKGEGFAVVESVKAASDVYAPLNGGVIAKNNDLVDSPNTVNDDPEGEGWFAKFNVGENVDLSGMMDRAAYDEYVSNL